MIDNKTYSLIGARRRFLLTQTVILLLYVLYMLLVRGVGSVASMIVLSSLNIVLYGWLAIKEIKLSNYFHPAMLLILGALQHLGAANIFAGINILSGTSYMMGVFDVTSSYPFGTVLISVEYYLFLLTYYYVDNKVQKNYRREHEDNGTRGHYFGWAVAIYLVVWLLRILDRTFVLASFSSLLNSFAQHGFFVSEMLLIISLLSKKSNKPALFVLWIIVIVEFVIAIPSGMKENMIIPLLPFVLYLIIRLNDGTLKFSSPRLWGYSFATVFIVVCFIFPFNYFFRDIANAQNVDWKNVKISDVADVYRSYVADENMTELLSFDNEYGMGYIMERASSAGCNAFGAEYAMKYGKQTQFFEFNMIKLVPRFLWPDKPLMMDGAMIANLLWDKGLTYSNEDRNSVTLGFIGGVWFSIGWFWALFFCLFAGGFFAVIYSGVRDSCSYNPFSLWLLLSMIIPLLKNFESFMDGGVVFYVWSIIFYILIKVSNPYLRRWIKGGVR